MHPGPLQGMGVEHGVAAEPHPDGRGGGRCGGCGRARAPVGADCGDAELRGEAADHSLSLEKGGYN